MIKHFELSLPDKTLAKIASYVPNDGTDFVHFHDNPHLSFVIKGGGIIKSKSISDERMPGNLVFFHAGDPHQCVAKTFPMINLNIEVGFDLLTENQLTESAVGEALQRNTSAKLLMLKIYKEILSNDDFSASSTKMLLIDLISNAQLSKNDPPLWVVKIYELMNDKWNEPLSLDDLAKECGVHQVTISKYFRKYFGCTFGEYMRRIKIEKSLSMIKNSRFSLTQIGYECGFYDQSHFSRTFQQLTGFSPRSYAKL